MRALRLILTILALVVPLLGCGSGTEQQPASDPQPGSVFSGTIQMGDASVGWVTLWVSEDGAAINLSIDLGSGLRENQAFRQENAGRLFECLSAFPSLSGGRFRNLAVTNGRFSGEDTTLGTIWGRFDTPATASGTLLLLAPTADCGSWPWSVHSVPN